MSYEGFAPYYDLLMNDAYYDDYASFILEHVHFNDALELGCGTGEIAIRLAKSGKQIIATDLSGDMLEIVQEKAFSEAVTLSVACLDMCDFDLNDPVDAIFILTDSLNYITSGEDVLKVLKNCYNSLKDEGTLLFDVDSLYKCDNILNDYHETIDDGDFHFKWDVSVDEDHHIKHVVDIKDGEEHINEIHHQYVMSTDDYLRLLKEAGFKNIQLYSDFEEYNETCERIIYQCVK